jgi:hypothetical protein
VLTAMYRLPMSRKLTDVEAYDRLHEALLSLGKEPGETTHGDTAIQAARRTLAMLQVGLLVIMEKSKAPEPPSDEPRCDPL